MSEEELPFYDALAANRSDVEVMGDQQLSIIAREVLVRSKVKSEWTVKESIPAPIL